MFLFKNGSWGWENRRAGGYGNFLENGPANRQLSLGQSEKTWGKKEFGDISGLSPLSSTYPSPDFLSPISPARHCTHSLSLGVQRGRRRRHRPCLHGMMKYRRKSQPQVILDPFLPLTHNEESISMSCQIYFQTITRIPLLLLSRSATTISCLNLAAGGCGRARRPLSGRDVCLLGQ